MFAGVTAALVTPLSATGEVPEQDVARLISSMRDSVTALLPGLSTGEGRYLTDAQWRAMLTATLRHSTGLPVLAGIQRPTTSQVMERAIEARELGAAAIVATSPYGAEVGQRAIFRHYQALAAGSGLPVVVYNESVLSGNETQLSTLLQVCRLPGVVGVKESSGRAEVIRRLIAAVPGVPVFQGMERLLLDSGPVDGYVISLANVEPAFCADLFANRTADRPTDRAAELADLCDRYELDRDDWYRPLKAELVRRGVLSTDLTAADLQRRRV